MELWDWPRGSILEVSKRIVKDAGQATYVELKVLANKNGLELNKDQRSKTAIALRAISTAHPTVTRLIGLDSVEVAACRNFRRSLPVG